MLVTYSRYTSLLLRFYTCCFKEVAELSVLFLVGCAPIQKQSHELERVESFKQIHNPQQDKQLHHDIC